jgi:hypothetical protein
LFTIYLDQNMWICLKDAVAGRASAERFAGLPEMCAAAVEAERCRFVLSYSHYEETQRRPRASDRAELAQVMLALSGAQTIAIPEVIIREEVRGALSDLFELDGELPTFDPFGWGADHAVGQPIVAGLVAASTIPREFQDAAIAELQFGALVGSMDDMPGLSDDHPLHSRVNNRSYVEQRTDLGERMKSWSRDRVRADNFIYASELVGLIPIIDEVAAPMGLSSSDVVALGREGLNRFMSLLPMQSIVAYLHRSVLLTSREWEVNDHNDVVYLSAAAAYCDAVVGERHWTSKLTEPRCPTQAGFIGSSPEDLRRLLGDLA